MCAVLVGGMDRLRNEYMEAAKEQGVSLKVFTGQERSIKSQIGDADMLILFTGKVSHAARKEALKYAKHNKIPVKMVHSSGVTALKGCFNCCSLGV